MLINKFKKIIISLLYVFCFITLFSCTKFDKGYNVSRLTSNVYLANEQMFAESIASKIVVPDGFNEKTMSNIGADSYFIGSTDRKKSSYTKYHNPYKKLPMASLTKLMTALVVLKNCKDLDEYYYVTTDAVDFEKDASVANLKPGDKVKVRDLLYGLLIPSGNDAAMVLAENLVDNYDNFIIMMNNEAETLGALNTHFANPHGLDSEYHFTTAYDLFLITRELSKYDIFSDITTRKEYKAVITASDGTERTETWVNTNYFVTEELLISANVSLLAGKTGNTNSAGNCLVLLMKDKKSNIRYISVVLNAKSKRNSYYNSNTLINAISNE